MTALKVGMPVLLKWNDVFYPGRIVEMTWALTDNGGAGMFEGVIQEGEHKGCKFLCTGGNYGASWCTPEDYEKLQKKASKPPLQVALPPDADLGALPEVGELLLVQRRADEWQTAKVTNTKGAEGLSTFWMVYLTGVWKGVSIMLTLRHEGIVWLRLGGKALERLNRDLAEKKERIVYLEKNLSTIMDELQAAGKDVDTWKLRCANEKVRLAWLQGEFQNLLKNVASFGEALNREEPDEHPH